MINEHVFSERVERHPSGDGNLTEYRPVCSCGWQGYGIASYNDDLFNRLAKQRKDHLRMASTATRIK